MQHSGLILALLSVLAYIIHALLSGVEVKALLEKRKKQPWTRLKGHPRARQGAVAAVVAVLSVPAVDHALGLWAVITDTVT